MGRASSPSAPPAYTLCQAWGGGLDPASNNESSTIPAALCGMELVHRLVERGIQPAQALLLGRTIPFACRFRSPRISLCLPLGPATRWLMAPVLARASHHDVGPKIKLELRRAAIG